MRLPRSHFEGSTQHTIYGTGEPIDPRMPCARVPAQHSTDRCAPVANPTQRAGALPRNLCSNKHAQKQAKGTKNVLTMSFVSSLPVIQYLPSGVHDTVFTHPLCPRSSPDSCSLRSVRGSLAKARWRGSGLHTPAPSRVMNWQGRLCFSVMGARLHIVGQVKRAGSRHAQQEEQLRTPVRLEPEEVREGGYADSKMHEIGDALSPSPL